ncbi:MAG: RnfABCDGE type electron transport complex subunit D [Spirochaetales bacterium]|jgi:electron transport complex protein RnfD|nr:RnfABCDGE type electron transport complex subunit D [Spirochaetales bacterium]
MAEHQSLLLSSSPHVFSNVNVRRLMLNVIIALLPATAYGIWLFGLLAVRVILTSIISCLVFEIVFRKLTGAKQNFKDLSAVVTGLLLALTLPPSLPSWMVVIGALAAIIMAKEFFGGLGQNPFNPALIGRAILLMSFPAAMTSWHTPPRLAAHLADAVTGASLSADALSTATPLNIIAQGGGLSDVAASLGLTSLPDLYTALFLGNRAGCIGEGSILLILLGGVFLIATKTIVFVTPVVMLAATALFSALLGSDPLFSVLAGGVAFGAFFMATDYATTPLTTAGKALFGLGAAIVLVLIRKFGGYPEGVTYGILMMNAVVPYLNKLREKKYGYIAKGAKK